MPGLCPPTAFPSQNGRTLFKSREVPGGCLDAGTPTFRPLSEKVNSKIHPPDKKGVRLYPQSHPRYKRLIRDTLQA